MRLLILACSARKRPKPGFAIEVYDGPLYRVLGKNVHPHLNLLVNILSAKYGLIPAFELIEPYDQRMNKQCASELKPSVRARLAIWEREDLEEVYIEVGSTYRLALPSDEELQAIFRCPIR